MEVFYVFLALGLCLCFALVRYLQQVQRHTDARLAVMQAQTELAKLQAEHMHLQVELQALRAERMAIWLERETARPATRH